MKRKRCRLCGRMRWITSFRRSANGRGGYRARCKTCDKLVDAGIIEGRPERDPSDAEKAEIQRRYREIRDAKIARGERPILWRKCKRTDGKVLWLPKPMPGWTVPIIETPVQEPDE